MEAQAGCDTACIASDPASTPLLGDNGCSAGAAGRVEDKVARISGHEEAASNYFRHSLNYICFLVGGWSITPSTSALFVWKIIIKQSIA